MSPVIKMVPYPSPKLGTDLGSSFRPVSGILMKAYLHLYHQDI